MTPTVAERLAPLMILQLPTVSRLFVPLAALVVLVVVADLSIDSYRAVLHLERARALLPLGRYDSALLELERAEELTPGDARVAREIGRVNYLMYAFRQNTGFAKEARASFERASALNPLDGYNFYELGRVRLNTGQIEPARTAIEQALERDPYNVAYLVSLGQVHERNGNFARARDAYQRAREVRKDPLVEARLRALPDR